MPLAATQVTGSLESAVSFTLTRTVYAVIVHKSDTGILLLTCAFLYMHLRFLARLARDTVLRNIVSRCMVLVLGVVALHLLSLIHI